MLLVLTENIPVVHGTSTHFCIKEKPILTLVTGLGFVCLFVLFLAKQVAESDTGCI